MRYKTMKKTTQNTRNTATENKRIMSATEYFKTLKDKKTIDVEKTAHDAKIGVYIRDKVVNYIPPTNNNKVVHTERINFTGFVYDNEETLQIMKDLANDLVNYLDNDKVYEIHCDPKKRKLMVRVNGNMIFKIFVQKKCYKIHLKHKADFEPFKFVNQNEVFYQNGFNLPYAYKTDLETVHKIVSAIA